MYDDFLATIALKKKICFFINKIISCRLDAMEKEREIKKANFFKERKSEQPGILNTHTSV